MVANYNRTVWFYDRLARLVYGKSIIRSQTEFLHLIPANARILVAGGGTGWILEEITEVHPRGLTIFYAEVSEKMLNLSAKRNWGDNVVIQYNQPAEELVLTGIDLVITPFLFNNYSAEEAGAIFVHVSDMLRAQGIWLNTDFQLTGRWWQHLLLKSMLMFFKLFGAVSNDNITNMQLVLERSGYKKIACKTFYGDFIRSDAWQKPV